MCFRFFFFVFEHIFSFDRAEYAEFIDIVDLFIASTIVKMFKFEKDQI